MVEVWINSQNDGLIEPTLYHNTNTKYVCRSIHELNIARGILRKNEGGNGLSICFDPDLLKKKEQLILIVHVRKALDVPNPQYKTPFSKNLDGKMVESLETYFNDAFNRENVREKLTRKQFYKKIAGQLLTGTNSSLDDIHKLAINLQNIKELSIGNIIELFEILSINLDDAIETDVMKKIDEFNCLDNLHVSKSVPKSNLINISQPEKKIHLVFLYVVY